MNKFINPSGFFIEGRTLPVLNLKRRIHFISIILKRVYEQMRNMLMHHSRIMVLRIDLHLSDPVENSDLVSKFMSRVKKKLKSKYGLRRVGHIWVREIEEASCPHYHVALMLDANRVYSALAVYWICYEVWRDLGQPKPYLPKNSFYVVKRGDNDSFDAAFRRLSYLAKREGKRRRPPAANDYSASRVSSREV